MFLKRNVLRKLMKDSFTHGGLSVSHDEYPEEEGSEYRPGYTVSGHGWAIWIDEAFVTKEMKADIIELCGELPGYGLQFRADKGHEGVQMEMYIERDRRLPEWWSRKGEPAYITRLVIAPEGRRIVQTNSASGLISEAFIDMYAPEKIDKAKGETAPTGPFETEEGILIGSNACYLFVQVWRDEKMSGFWDRLDTMNIYDLMTQQ